MTCHSGRACNMEQATGKRKVAFKIQSTNRRNSRLWRKRAKDAPDFLTVSARRPGKGLSAKVMTKGLSTQIAQPIVRHARKPTRNGWIRWLPGLDMLRQYELSWLRHDVVAGLVMTTMLVPVGIAYAEASGVPGINGLYATIVPLLAYAIFGPSRILVLGPDSALAAVILATIAPLAAGDPARAVALASTMAVVSGLVCIGVGLAKLG